MFKRCRPGPELWLIEERLTDASADYSGRGCVGDAGQPGLPGRHDTVPAHEGFAFEPQQVTVHVGDTLKWANQDIVAHTATAKDKAGITLRGLAEMGSATCPPLCRYTRSFAPRGERLGLEEPVRSGGSEMTQER